MFTKPAGFENYFIEISQLPPNRFHDGVLENNKRFGIQFVGKPIAADTQFWGDLAP